MGIKEKFLAVGDTSLESVRAQRKSRLFSSRERNESRDGAIAFLNSRRLSDASETFLSAPPQPLAISRFLVCLRRTEAIQGSPDKCRARSKLISRIVSRGGEGKPRSFSPAAISSIALSELGLNKKYPGNIHSLRDITVQLRDTDVDKMDAGKKEARQWIHNG
jgi:hypothetical protein